MADQCVDPETEPRQRGE